MSFAPRGVIFDLDGVITDTAELHFAAWWRLAQEEGLGFDRALNEHLRGLSRADSLRVILGSSDVDGERFEAMLDRKNRYYVASLHELGPEDVLPGARRMIDQARARGWRLAIGSSSRNARTVLERLELSEAFDAIADGNTVRAAKPAPDLFLAAARMIDVEPEECVVVEDASSGVDAGLAAGMTTIGVGPPDRVGHAHLRFDSPADVDFDVLFEIDRGSGP